MRSSERCLRLVSNTSCCLGVDSTSVFGAVDHRHAPQSLVLQFDDSCWNVTFSSIALVTIKKNVIKECNILMNKKNLK